MSLDPWRLRLLCQFETLGTVRAVAGAAHQSPSSVSQQLGVLEAEVGAQLFVRAGRRLRMTPAAHVLASHGRGILDAIAAAEADLRAADGVLSGFVRVAAFQSAVHALAVPAAAALQEREPSVRVQVVELESHLSADALLRGDVDLTITTTDFLDAPVRRDLHVVPVTKDPIVVVAAPSHPAAVPGPVELSTLAEQWWTLEPEDTWMGAVAARLCRSAGFEPKVACRFSSYHLALRHVQDGRSISLLPAMAVDPGYDVVARPLSPSVERNVVAAIRSSSRPVPAVRALLEDIAVEPQPDAGGPDRSR